MDKKVIFKQELQTLKEKGYIQEEQFQEINQAYDSYQHEEWKRQRQEMLAKIKETEEQEIQKKKQKEQVKPKINLSPQEIRERNITWLLIVGVVMFLIGGMVFATNNWDSMNALMKTSVIALVAGMFLGMQYVTEKLLKIEKTSFAFAILGSLFVPITVLSAGYFELFGKWLSINGEGKFLLGLLGCLVSLPLYWKQSTKYQSRLFTWFALLFISAAVGFFLQVCRVPKDVFYLGIVLYNAGLLYCYFILNKKEKTILWIKELPIFAQVNLIVSTIMTLCFYSEHVFYGFNITLTAIMYMAMIFVYKQKYYHYVATVLLVYGLYQIIQYSALVHINAIAFASIGCIFLLMKKDMEQTFRYTSAFVSLCAFIFISVQSFLLQGNQPSWVMCIAYAIIAIQFIYLSHKVKKQVFYYLAPIFASVSLLQIARMTGDTWFSIYFIGVVLLVAGYYLNKWHITKCIKESSLHISLGVMLLGICSQIQIDHTSRLAFLLFITSALTYFLSKEKEKWKEQTFLFISPLSFLLSLWVTYSYIIHTFYEYKEYVGISGHFGVSALLTLGIAYLFKWKKEKMFTYYFYTAYVSYTIALLWLLVEQSSYMLECSLLSLGIALYVWFKKETKIASSWAAISIVVLANYYVITTEFFPGSYQGIIGSYVLIAIMEIVMYKKGKINEYLYYLAHINGFVSLFQANNSALIYVAALMFYIYSIGKRKNIYEKIAMLYMSFLLFQIALETGISELHNLSFIPYVFLITSVSLFLLAIKLKGSLKTYTNYYVLLHSLIGISVMMMEETTLLLILCTIVYSILPIFLLHKLKWSYGLIIPFSLLMIEIGNIQNINDIDPSILFYIYLGVSLALNEISLFLHPKLWNKKEWFIDWYVFFSIIAIGCSLSWMENNPTILESVLPGMVLVYLLYRQKTRVYTDIQRKIVLTLTGISVLYPYYAMLSMLAIPSLWEAEFFVLPWIMLTILLSKKLWMEYQLIISRVQWVVLLIVTAILLKDALDSNTVYDALIMGSLAIISLLGGIHYKIKSYFFVGVGVVLLNIFLQTKPFWGSMPWWAYLLIGGTILIGFASFYEWQKEKKNQHGETLIQQKKKQWKSSFDRWN